MKSAKLFVSAIVGFPPIVSANARLLILGSMPSEISLQREQYYGYRQNAFWIIMGELFGAFPDMDYQSRQKILMQNGIAVWDVLKTCRRKGSMDADIEMSSIETNNFADFFVQYPLIKSVYFNGGTAEKVYNKQVLPFIAEQFDYLHYQRLPSTSPAYAAMTRAKKIAAWEVIA